MFRSRSNILLFNITLLLLVNFPLILIETAIAIVMIVNKIFSSSINKKEKPQVRLRRDKKAVIAGREFE